MVVSLDGLPQETTLLYQPITLDTLSSIRMTLHCMLDRLPNDIALLNALIVLLRPWLDP